MNLICDLSRSAVNISEMSLIRNLHWWTVEYGLIGESGQPKNLWGRIIVFNW